MIRDVSQNYELSFVAVSSMQTQPTVPASEPPSQGGPRRKGSVMMTMSSEPGAVWPSITLFNGGSPCSVTHVAEETAWLDKYPKFHTGRLVWEALEADNWGELEATLSCLAESKLNDAFDLTNEDGDTPLHRAAYRGFPKTLAVLLRFGPKRTLSSLNKKGETPAFIAEQRGHKDCLDVLLIHGSPKPCPQQPLKFEASFFKTRGVLGSGSFGVVTLAEYKPSSGCYSDARAPATPRLSGCTTSPNTPRSSASASFAAAASTPRMFALKAMNKAKIAATGQVPNVIEEKQLLQSLNSPFVLKLFGVFQTAHEVVMVTEVVEGVDLWTAIYQEGLVPDRSGVPHYLAPLYAAGIILALDHMHSKGIAYRDLKAENVMIDRQGYAKVIDLGLAKRLDHGEKAYTLCGTPEYVSPEMVCKSGHDWKSDLWSLGVLIYEMIQGRTPFLPKQRSEDSDITAVLTNIVLAGKNGICLSTSMDARAGNTPHARALVSQLLTGKPQARLGPSAKEGALTATLLDHPYFTSSLDVESVRSRAFVPEWVPEWEERMLRDADECDAPFEPYLGDQGLFDDF